MGIFWKYTVTLVPKGKFFGLNLPPATVILPVNFSVTHHIFLKCFCACYLTPYPPSPLEHPLTPHLVDGVGYCLVYPFLKRDGSQKCNVKLELNIRAGGCWEGGIQVKTPYWIVYFTACVASILYTCFSQPCNIR